MSGRLELWNHDVIVTLKFLTLNEQNKHVNYVLLKKKKEKTRKKKQSSESAYYMSLKRGKGLSFYVKGRET